MIWVIVIAIAAAAGWLLGLAQGGNRKTKTNRELEATIRALENQLSTLADYAAALEAEKRGFVIPKTQAPAKPAPPSGSDPSPY